ncbi:MAG: lipid A biosynthesis lauroyl acyltransferase [Sulfuricurvum sp.]|nr:lipid A biosynthesis lauroyl acyltransferase [Sulfuricurvum sp.]
MIGFRLFLTLNWLLMALPSSWRKAFFIALSNAAYVFDRRRKKIIRQNLSFAFQNTLSLEEQEEIERYCYRNLALNFLQVMENRHNNTSDLASKVTFENRHIVDELLAQNKGIIFVSAHFGNWELGASALASLITPLTSIYKALDNQNFEPYLVEARQRHNIKLVERNGALKHLARALKNHHSVSLLIDQSINVRQGIAVKFFDHLTYHSPAAANLSYKYNAPIVPLYITRVENDEHYTITFFDPIYVEDETEKSIKIATQRQVAILEEVIRKNPKLWFWCHKRWKGEHPEIYAG